MSPTETLRSAIITLLSERQQIGMGGDLSCYASDGFYCVDYIYSSETVDFLTLTDREKKTIIDEEELVEYFETPEEAADFYLRLTGGKMAIPSDCNGKKRTVREKVASYDNDQYF